MNNVTTVLATSVSKVIKKMAILAANSASYMGVYQPLEPKEMKKFKKTK